MDPFKIDQDMLDTIGDVDEEGLLLLLEANEDPDDDVQIEVSIYLFFTAHTITGSEDYIHRALQLAEGWVATTPQDSPNHQRRSEILNFLTTRYHIYMDRKISHEFSVDYVSQLASLILTDNTQGAHGMGTLDDYDESLHRLDQRLERYPPGRPSSEQLLLAKVAFHRARYLLTKSISDLTLAIESAELLLTVDFTETGSVKESIEEKIAKWYKVRFQVTRSISDSERAVEIYQALLNKTPTSSPSRAARLLNVVMALQERFYVTFSKADLEKAIDAASETLIAISDDVPERVFALCSITALLETKTVMYGSIDDVNHAIYVIESDAEAVDSSGMLDSLLVVAYLTCLHTRHSITGDVEDLNRGILLVERVLREVPVDSIVYGTYHELLARSLCKRFQKTRNINDLSHAEELAHIAVESPTQSDHEVQVVTTLGVIQGLLFIETGEEVHLDSAITTLEKAADSHTVGQTDRFMLVQNLCHWYQRRCDITGNIDSISAAIDRMADLMNDIDPAKNLYFIPGWDTMATLLGKRFNLLGHRDDLEQAISFNRKAVEVTPKGHASQAIFKNNQGLWAGAMFGYESQISSLNEAIQTIETALASLTPEDTNWVFLRGNLAGQLSKRSNFTGSLDDLNRAIENAQLVVDHLPIGHSDRNTYLMNLGSYLAIRFGKVGGIEDLDRAIMSNLSLSERHSRVQDGNQVAKWLGQRFSYSRELNDIDTAIKLASLALAEIPIETVSFASCAHNLGSLLEDRYRMTKNSEDIERAIQTVELGIDSVQGDSLEKLHCYETMTTIFTSRFHESGEIADLDKAIEYQKQVLDATHLNDSDRARKLKSLAHCYHHKWEITNSLEDKSAYRDASLSGWKCLQAPASVRIFHGRRLIDMYDHDEDWTKSFEIYREIVKLVSSVSHRALSHSEKQRKLEDLTGIGSRAAAAALRAGEHAAVALQMLEQGRSVIAGLILDMRSDASGLVRADPDLAREFEDLRTALDVPEQPHSHEHDHHRQDFNLRHNLNNRLEMTIAKIRKVPGFENFLQPPSAEEMMRVAKQGPLVIPIIHGESPVAFIVRSDSIDILPLVNVDFPTLMDNYSKLRNDLVSVLEWLWDTITCPVLDHLGLTQPIHDDTEWRRIWWIPTGPFVFFPFHASGKHTSLAQETVLDRVMSSYSSSIKSLLYTRHHDIRPQKDAILVAMPETPDQSSLPSASREIHVVQELCSAFDFDAQKYTQPTKDDVLQQLKGSSIFHFAGHGTFDSEKPSKSGLLMSDWKETPLTVGDMRDLRLHEDPPFLSYLSACSTGPIPSRAFDESVHFINSCQLAGFRHAVGTMWEVSDDHCVDVARILYSTLKKDGITDKAVCLGLHKAVRYLRDVDCGSLARRTGTQNENDSTLGDREGECSDSTDEIQAPDARTAVLKPKRKKRAQLYWVPYVHFGV